MPNMVNNIVKLFITVAAVISTQGNENTNRLYSSTTFNKYLFLVLLGSGPLKSILNLSKGCIALMSAV